MTWSFSDYNISITFGGNYNSYNFKQEIIASSINNTKTIIDTGSLGDQIILIFDYELDAGELVVLDGLVSLHNSITNQNDLIYDSQQLISNSNIATSAAIDATKIANGTVTSTEFQYINSLTSNAQNQLNTRVVGPESSIDNAIARFDTTTGLLIKDSSVLCDDSNNLSGLGYLQLTDMTEPINPSDGQGRLYKKTGDNGIFWKPDSVGTEIDLTDPPFNPTSYISWINPQYIAYENEKTTSSTTLQTALTLTTSSLTSGTYWFDYCFHIGNTENNDRLEVEVKLDDSNVALISCRSDTDYNYHGMSGFYQKSLSGIITATIKHRVYDNNEGTSKIKKMRMKLVRIS